MSDDPPDGPGQLQIGPDGQPVYVCTYESCNAYCDKCSQNCDCQRGDCGDCGDCKESKCSRHAASVILTCWLGSDILRMNKAAVLRLSGRMQGHAVSGKFATFDCDIPLDMVPETNGMVALTTRIPHLHPGSWSIKAMLPDGQGSHEWSAEGPNRASTVLGESEVRLSKPRRIAPGLMPTAWAKCVTGGFVFGFLIHICLLIHNNISLARALPLTCGSVCVGLAGAPMWFMIKHRLSWRRFRGLGLCVQGFLVCFLLAMALGVVILSLPASRFLSCVTPALFFGLAVGRIGCFLGGCCAGRPTGSAWGVWSSDGILGVRRVPTQLLESAACLLIGFATLLGSGQQAVSLAAFVGSWVAYTTFRQGVIFPLRAKSGMPALPA